MSAYIDAERGMLIMPNGEELFIVPNKLDISIDEFFEHRKPEWVQEMQATIESQKEEIVQKDSFNVGLTKQILGLEKQLEGRRKQLQASRDSVYGISVEADEARHEKRVAQEALELAVKALEEINALIGSYEFAPFDDIGATIEYTLGEIKKGV